jgi:hypothetical protein
MTMTLWAGVRVSGFRSSPTKSPPLVVEVRYGKKPGTSTTDSPKSTL